MDPSLWLERWQAGQIGFHLTDVNPRLLAHHHLLPPGHVFVPLSGKSLDLAWLASHGHQVTGVELSELAVHAFFAEQGLTPTRQPEGALTAYRAGPLTLYCGDFFALTRAQLATVSAYYDRAALVALPAELRTRYVAHLTTLLPAAAEGLLVSFEYAGGQKSGPPFSVSEAEVRALYEPRFAVECVASHDILGDEARFRSAGVTSLLERVYRLSRPA